jgi:hypothetical protein
MAPSAMIFLPNIDGVSRYPRDRARAADLAAGENPLLDAVKRLATAP